MGTKFSQKVQVRGITNRSLISFHENIHTNYPQQGEKVKIPLLPNNVGKWECFAILRPSEWSRHHPTSTRTCCVFWLAKAWVQMAKNNEEHLKMVKQYLFHWAHKRLKLKNESESLLVSNCKREWLPNAGWQLIAGSSWHILLFLIVFNMSRGKTYFH